jgi:copper(I)-binding protein
VRVTAARVELGAGGSATAFLTVENGTMYEVYLVGASTEMADSVELMQYSADSTAPVKEVAIPAFDRLEMSSQSVFMKLTDLKRPLKPGENITITLRTDSGEELSAAATVK